MRFAAGWVSGRLPIQPVGRLYDGRQDRRPDHEFLENFVDDETQEIHCTVAAACAARQMVDLLGSRGADCELITFNDEHECGTLAARFWATMYAPGI